VKRKNFLWILLALLILWTAACERFGTVDIGKITADPREYAGRTVAVRGRVSEVFSLMVIKYFVVEDKTGRIAVITDRPLPRQGTEVKVRGTVKEAFSIGDQQLLVLVEEEKKN
jgi:aspartyl/asparaginyl-tRNA synthetase